MRCQALDEPHYFARDIVEHDRRIDASIRAMQTCAEDSWEFCREALQFEGSGEAFTASILAYSSSDAEKVKHITEHALLNDEVHKAVCSGIAWLNNSQSLVWLKKFLMSSNPDHRYLGIRVCSALQISPAKTLGQIFSDTKFHEHELLLSRTLRLVGELKLVHFAQWLVKFQTDERQSVQFWALWSSAMLGNRSCMTALLPFTQNETDQTSFAIDLYCRTASIDRSRELISFLVKGNQTRLAIKACSSLGDPEAIPWLVRQMDDVTFARAAAESFYHITGIDVAAESLIAEDVVEEGDDDEGIYEDQFLAWPDAERVEEKWKQVHANFDKGCRYFLGQKIEAVDLSNISKISSSRVRRAAALESALRNSNEILTNIESRIAS